MSETVWIVGCTVLFHIYTAKEHTHTTKFYKNEAINNGVD